MNEHIDDMAKAICHTPNCKLKKANEPCYKYCKAYIYAFRATNAGYRKPEWISVEERLPDQDGKYLAYTRRGFIVLSYYYALEGAFGFEHWDVTHWMPLPMPPKGDEGK